MRAIKEFSIYLGPRKSSEDDPSFEEIGKTSDKSADELYIEFVHKAITYMMDRPSPETQSSLDNLFSNILKQPVWVNEPFLSYMLYIDRTYPGITFYPDKILDRHGNPVDTDFSDKKLIDGIGSALGCIFETEWIRTLIVMNDVQNSQNLSDRKNLFLKDLNEVWPTAEKDQQGSLRIFSMSVPTAPIITVMRTKITKDAKVPIYFVSTRDNAELLIRDSTFMTEFNKITEGLAPLLHTIKGSNTVSFLMIPFLYHMFPSAKAFHRAMENYLKQHEKDLGLCWLVENCFVMIHHKGKDYEPKDGQKSLNM